MLEQALEGFSLMFEIVLWKLNFYVYTPVPIAPLVGSKLAELPSTAPLPGVDGSESSQPMDTTPPTATVTQPSPARSGSSPALTNGQQHQQGTTTPKSSSTSMVDFTVYMFVCSISYCVFL